MAFISQTMGRFRDQVDLLFWMIDLSAKKRFIDMLKWLLVLVGLTLQAEAKPNIVVILSDDHAWDDYGFMGHPEIKTPRLDQLAAKSRVYERGYVAAPICRPSLASIVTGRFPFTHGITGNDVDGRNQRAALDVPFRESFHELPSFVRLLSENGYLTHQSGKWWEGSWKQGGFTHGMTHGDPKRGGRHGDQGLAIGRKGMKPISDFLDLAKKEEKPFMLWYAPFLPHTPHNPPERFLEKFQKEGRPAGDAKYYAMCEWFDETCGQLVDMLDAKKLSEDTLILYIADNGWATPTSNAADPNQKLWKEYAQRSKSSPYEDGVRTPILMSWPGKVTPGRDPKFAHGIDFFPTIAAAAGLKAPADLPGINLLDEAEVKKRKVVFGVTHSTHNMSKGNPDEVLQYLWAVDEEWKILVRYFGKDTTKYKNLHVWDTAPVRLFNMKSDPHELKDVAKENPEVVARLKADIEKWYSVSGY